MLLVSLHDDGGIVNFVKVIAVLLADIKPRDLRFC